MLEKYPDIIKDLGYTELFKFYADYDWENQDADNWFEQKNDILKAVQDVVNMAAGQHVQYALWLADADDVKHLYSNGTCDTLDGYDTSNTYPISCLGHDGTLYGYIDEPIPVKNIDIVNPDIEYEPVLEDEEFR
jgi:hypothetical protein